jgi:hypothetical protein
VNLSARTPKWVRPGMALFLATTAGIGIGMILEREAVPKRDQLWIEQLPLEERPGAAAAISAGKRPLIDPAIPASAPKSLPAGGEVVASKTGTAYYLPWCTGAARITNEKKITFASKEKAEASGYHPAKNCKGL